MRRLLAIILSLAFVLPLLAVPVAAEEERLFPETGMRVRGDFLRFYDAKGGVDIFGPAITGELVENGRTVQYFARARLESWPENPQGYRVQLGLLGVELGKVQPHIDGVPESGPLHRYFPETGHVVAFAFKDFWESHGGVEIFGYPTTEQLVENGVVVQYFQRARLEWHPENPPGSQVLLGDLGSEYLRSRGVPVPVAVPSTVATPADPILVESEASGAGRLVFHLASGGDIYTVHPDGSALRQAAQGMDPTWSPDGTKIAYAAWYPPGIYVADADGGNAYRVPFSTYPWEVLMPQALSWSPDGRYIAFHEKYRDYRPVWRLVDGRRQQVMERMDLWRIDIVDVQTGQVHVIAQDDFGVSPSWGPDGRLVFESTQGLFVLNAVEGQREIAKVPNTDPRFASPAWSPDGEWLTFMWHQHDHWEVGIIRLDGSGFRLLTSSPSFTTPAHNVSPAWSPDGKEIAFASNRNGKWELFVMDADSGNQRAVDIGDLELRYDFARERVVSWGGSVGP